MSRSRILRIAFIAIALGSALAPSLAAQSLAAIAGSWQGDKALGTVLIREGGTGEITFESNSELKMAIQVSAQGQEFVITQAEPNKPEFYRAFGLVPAAAAKMSGQARPMRWIFRLSADKGQLAGKKETTSYKRLESGDVTDIKNDYVRDSTWTRLTGKVASPVISPASGSFAAAQSVSISCETPGATIRYALNGELLSETSGQVYSGPIQAAADTVLAAIAVKDKWQVSDAVRVEYKVAGPAARGLPQKAKWRDFEFELNRCVREGDEVIVELRATNKRELNRWFGIDRWPTRFLDGDGNVYDKNDTFFASSAASPGNTASGQIPQEVPVKLKVQFERVPPSVRSLALLEIHVNSEHEETILKFKDVPVSE